LADMTNKGRRVAGLPGAANLNAKLTEDQVLNIYNETSRSARSMAIELGVSPELAQQIRRGVCWKHLTQNNHC